MLLLKHPGTLETNCIRNKNRVKIGHVGGDMFYDVYAVMFQWKSICLELKA